MPTDIKRYIKFKNNPALAMLESVEQSEKMAQKMIEAHVNQAIDQARTTFQSTVDELIRNVPALQKQVYQEVMSKAEKYIGNNIELFKGKDGTNADAITAKVMTMIKLPKAGEHFPTHKQVREMVRTEIGKLPLPEVPTDEIVKDVLSKIKIEYPKVEIPEVTGEEIVNKVNALPIEPRYQIDAKHIKNFPKTLAKTLSKKGGGGDIVMFYDLSSQTDGSTLSFTVPYGRRAIVLGSDFPSVLMEGNGFTVNASRTTLTLTVANAPSTGSQLLYQYII